MTGKSLIPYIVPVLPIEGSKGGAKRPYIPIEEDDTLFSKQVVKLLFAISEGEISNVDDILLDQVPIANYSAVWNWRSGTATQGIIPGFIDTEEPLSTFTPLSMTSRIEYTILIPADANSCRAVFTLGALKQTNKRNDIIGYESTIKVEVRASNGHTWTTLGNIVRKGKASSPFSYAFNIGRPSTGVVDPGWQIRLTNLNPPDTAKLVSPLTWSGAFAIRFKALNYPNTALIGVILTDAQQFGGTVPEITFKVKGIKVKIPINYDPVNKTYNEGTPWTGGLTETLFHYTDNPAWHIYNILNNSNYGLDISKSDIDIISLYNLSKFADQLVPDGAGGLERRFTLNNQFYIREKPPVFLMYMLSLCNANISDNEFGQISIIFDHPNQPVSKQVANSNIVAGKFSYSSSELEARYNLVNVTFNREAFNGKTDTATETEASLVTRYGLQTTDIVLPGCTSESQALRKARWALFTSSYLPDIVNYKVLFAGLTYHVGELVRVFDNDNQGNTQSGIIRSVVSTSSETTFTLDIEVTLAAEQYTISFIDADGITERTYPIFESDIKTNIVSIGIRAASVENGIFILSGRIQPREYKVVKISKDDEIYTISALIHKEEKYLYIDKDILLFQPTGDFVDATEYTTRPVTDIIFIENFSGVNGIAGHSLLEISWQWDKRDLKYDAIFSVLWKRDSQEGVFTENLASNTFDIVNPIPGTYEVTVWATNTFTNIRSAPTIATYAFKVVSATSSLLPPVDIYIAGTVGLEFATQDVHLVFNYNPANAGVSDTLLDYVIEVWDRTNVNMVGTYVVKPNQNGGGEFHFSFTENADRFGTPTRTFSIKLYSRDTIGDVSAPAIVEVTNPSPATVPFTVVSGLEATYIDITPSPALDLEGYVIYRSEISGYTPDTSHIVYRGKDSYNVILGDTGATYYYRVAAYDTFGLDGLNIAQEQVTTLLSGKVDVWVFTGLLFKPNDPDDNHVSWTEGTASKNGEAAFNIEAGSAEWTSNMISQILYVYYIDGDDHLTATDDILLVVQGVLALATYKGGLDLTVGDGKAFTDGGLILANTVGANQLIADKAIITSVLQVANAIIRSGHIQNGAIINAKIGNIIQSINFSHATNTGWQINKQGDIVSYGALQLLDNQGNPVLVTNILWDNIVGFGKPEDFATFGAAWSDVTGALKPEDRATFGSLWTQVVGTGKPEDNATFGSTWDNVTGSSRPEDNATEGATWGRNIDGANRPENNATRGATFGSNITGQMSATTIGTYIAAAAIVTALIKDGAIVNAKIGNFIQSTNYIPGVSGWNVNKNGTAEFDATVIRGVLSADHIDSDVFNVVVLWNGGILSAVGGRNFPMNELITDFDTILGVGAAANAELYASWSIPRSRIPSTSSGITVSIYTPTGGSRDEWESTRIAHINNGTLVLTSTGDGSRIGTIWGIKNPGTISPTPPGPPPPGTPTLQAPGTPGSPVATSRTTTTITVDVNPGSGGAVTTWRWRLSLDSIVNDSDTITTSSSVPAIFRNLTPGTNYWIDVRGENSAGESNYSLNLATSTTGSAPPPGVPTVQAPGTPNTPILSSRTSSSLTLRTSAGGGGAVTRYRWRYSTNSSVTDSDPDVTSTSTTRTISGLSPNTSYWIDVRAENSAGDSNYSNDLATSTTTSTPPGPPGVTINLIVSPGSATVNIGSTRAISIRLSAAPSSNVVVRASFPSTEDDAEISGATSRTFTSSNWSSNQTITVRALDDGSSLQQTATLTLQASGGSTASATVLITIPRSATPPGPPGPPGTPTDFTLSMTISSPTYSTANGGDIICRMNSSNLVPSAFVVGGGIAYVVYFRFIRNGAGGLSRWEIRLNSSNIQTGAGNAGPEFLTDVENNLVLQMSSGGQTVTVNGLNDSSEPYVWSESRTIADNFLANYSSGDPITIRISYS